MNKYWALTRVNVVMSLYQLNMMQRHRGNRRGRGLIYGLAAVVVIILAYMTFWAIMLSRALNDSGFEWVILAIALLIITFAVFAMNLYSLNALLFESLDTDQLFAYPLSKLTIVAAKMSGLLIENWMIAAAFWLPFVGVYAWYQQPGVLFYAFALVCLVLSPAIPLFASGLISYVVGLLSSGVRFRRAVSVVLTAGLLGGLIWGLVHAIKNLRLDVGGDVFAMMQRYYPPIGYAADALANGSWAAMGLAVLWNAVPFVALCALIAASYTFIHTRTQAVAKPVSGRVTYSGTSASRALFGKELRRLFFSPMYLLNACMGGVLLIVFVALLGRNINRVGGLFAVLAQQGITIDRVMLVLFLVFLSMTTTTSASISLEGKSFWIIKSAPVSPWQVLRAKLGLHVVIVVPLTTIAALLAVVLRGVSGVGFVTIIVPSLLFALVGGCVGLVYNLHNYRFDFYNDQQVVRGSASALLTIGTMIVLAAVVVFGFWLGTHFWQMPFWPYWTAWVVLFAGATVGLVRYLMTTGVRLFDDIS